MHDAGAGYVAGKLEADAKSSERFNETYARYLEQLRGVAAVPEGARVLDVASGTGKWSTWLASRGMRVHAVDRVEKFAQITAQRARIQGLTVEAICADGTRLPYRDGAFDVVTLLSVLEHVPDWEAMVSEAVRVVRPGGLLWLTGTNAWCPVTAEIQGFPLYPWYPAPVKTRILDWVMRNRPELVAYSPAPAVHWFTYGQMLRHLGRLGVERTATQVEHMRPRSGWKRGLQALLRRSALLRQAFYVVQPGLSVMAIKRDDLVTSLADYRAQPARPPHPAASGPSVLLSEEQARVVACPACRGGLADDGPARLCCRACERRYDVREGIAVMSVEQSTLPGPESIRPVSVPAGV